MLGACGGDADSYGRLVGRHWLAALRVATVVLGTATGADDVAQEAVHRAWRAMDSFDADRPFRPWLLRIVANCAHNDRRTRMRRATLAVRSADVSPPPPQTPEEHAMTTADRMAVIGALNRLRAPDRLVIALRYFEQLNEDEMAVVLQCRPGTVKSRLSRATQRLRDQLVAEGADDV